jgi:uncharacterized protein YgbK (DUF1537 family)
MSLLQQIRQANQSDHLKIVVLDDDPTGCQTVHAVPILMSWEGDLLQKTLENHDLAFILTNTRAFSAEKARAVTAEIVAKLKHLIPLHQLRIISRSDSTLRGHYWAETQTICAEIAADGVIVAPFFEEGGRVTKNSTHYLKDGNQYTDVSQTEFARDPVFGFSAGYLPAWIEEKSDGYWTEKEVVRITLSDIRIGNVNQILAKLMPCEHGLPVVVDAEHESDLAQVVMALIEAERQGKRFVYRTAASFVKVRNGIVKRPIISPQKTGKAGLIVVGSHVAKTTTQLQYLLQNNALSTLEISIQKVLADRADEYLQAISQQTDHLLQQRQTVVLFTERQYQLNDDTPNQRLQKGQIISNFVCDLVSNLHTKPDFMIAKGGITSLEVARRGLSTKQATVIGQIAEGVPIWELGDESKFPSMPYVVFPGNVGDETTLDEVFRKFN